MIRRLFFILSFWVCVIGTQAQNVYSLYYTTEVQTAFKSKVQWVNLLEFQGNVRLWKNGSLYFLTQTVYQTHKEQIVSNLMTFSNIEAYNEWISPFIFGISQKIDKLNLFFGLRNINEDYFTYPYTSLYINSSSGIYPTISINYPRCANYPLSAVCLHLEYDFGRGFSINNSLYNGIARPVTKGWIMLSVAPARDGLFNVTELKYTHKTGVATVGGVYDSKEINYNLWANCEQDFFSYDKSKIGGLVQTSFAPASKNFCKNYLGLGLVATGLIFPKSSDKIAVIATRGGFTDIAESTVEISWICPISKSLSLQPACHFIKTGNQRNTVGMLRVNYEL